MSKVHDFESLLVLATLFIAILVAMCCSGGCTPADQFVKIAQTPIVQQTLQEWQTEGGYDNPEVLFVWGTCLLAQVEGVTSTYVVEGDRHGGVDPRLTGEFYRIAIEAGLDPRTDFDKMLEVFREAMLSFSWDPAEAD